MQVPRPTLEILERTRRGEALDPADVVALANAWSVGSASDAQMSAWCATAGVRDASPEVVSALSSTILGGGDRLELATLGPTAEIRATGGVGDSAAVFAASATAASLGIIVASTGTRGISHTGGILDALEAIPGMQPELTLEQYVLQARDFGIVIAEAGETLVPGERRLADLRESTATSSGDLLVAVSAAVRGVSGGPAHLIVLISAGSGALLPDRDHAVRAGELIGHVASEWHRGCRVFTVTRDTPLAGVAGHALEIAAAAAVLRGEGDPALREIVVTLADAAAEAAGVPQGAAAALDDGRALATAERWVEAQGGDPAALTDTALLVQPLLQHEVAAQSGGRVASVDAGVVGLAARWLGAGRLDPDQVVDPAVGVEITARPGDTVAPGDALGIVHASDSWLADRAVDMLGEAWVITED